MKMKSILILLFILTFLIPVRASAEGGPIAAAYENAAKNEAAASPAPGEAPADSGKDPISTVGEERPETGGGPPPATCAASPAAGDGLYSTETLEEMVQDMRTIQKGAEQITAESRNAASIVCACIMQTLGKLWRACENTIRHYRHIQLELEDENELGETKADILAKIMRLEFGGADTGNPVWRMHTAAIGWCVLNRVDAGIGTLEQVAKAPHQFAYVYGTEVREDLRAIATDVLIRWYLEKAEGCGTTGRVLDPEMLYFWGDGKVNHYYSSYRNRRLSEWDWSLPNPYEAGSG